MPCKTKRRTVKGAEGNKVGGTPEGMRQTYKQTGKVEGLGHNPKGSHGSMGKRTGSRSRGGY